MLAVQYHDQRLRLGHHAAVTCVVPMLEGDWFYHSTCACSGAFVHGVEERHRDARRAHLRLPCASHIWQVTVKQALPTETAVALVSDHCPGRTVAREPYARLLPRLTGRPRDVAVDASVRENIVSVAAVSGRGWLKLWRESYIRPPVTTAAEVLAICAGLDLVPEGSFGNVWSDCQPAVDEIGRWRRCDFAVKPPHWLAADTYHWLADLLNTRRMRVRWRPRNSTLMLELADTYSKLGAAREFNAAGMATRTRWVRRDDEELDGATVRHCYRLPNGKLSED